MGFMNKLFLALVVMLTGCNFNSSVDLCQIQQAVHSWNELMWPEDNYELTIYNSSTTNDWDESLTRTIEGWNALDTVFTLKEVGHQQGADIYVRIKEGEEWLGLAEIYTDPEEGFITKARVSMSPTLLTLYNKYAIDHVFCQEIGHALGLTHIVGDTCMDSCSSYGPGSDSKKSCIENPYKSTPNEHDEEQLVIIYGPSPEMECD